MYLACFLRAVKQLSKKQLLKENQELREENARLRQEVELLRQKMDCKRHASCLIDIVLTFRPEMP
jgi:cell division protein FtsB